MKKILIITLIFFAAATSCLSVDPVMISRDNGMAILANLTGSSFYLSAAQGSIAQNQTNQTNETGLQDNKNLWSWGRTPLGYEVSDEGTLIRLEGEEWAPSI